MRKIEKVVEKLISQTKSGEIDWYSLEWSEKGYVSEIEGEDVRVYRSGQMSVGGWKHQSEKVLRLYKTIRAESRPDFVEDFFESVLNE